MRISHRHVLDTPVEVVHFLSSIPSGEGLVLHDDHRARHLIISYADTTEPGIDFDQLRDALEGRR
jgi:hypothetical protein